MALPEPHLLKAPETSLRPLKRGTGAGNRFESSYNGGRAGRREARGDCVDEAPFCFKTGVTKPSTPINLDRQRQIITRLQSLHIASTFPLLALPAELRVIIYGFCFSFSGIENWFDKFWQVLKTSRRPSHATPPLVWKRAPEVLLICKQVYHEAREVLKKQSISFHHGLLDLTGLGNLMNTDILKNITSLTIDAKGHDILPKTKSLVGPSWRGHLDLIVDVSNALANGHRLKTFTLDFTDASIHSHVHDCWFKAIRCDYRDQLTEALMHLRKIRSVGTVNLLGIPTAMIPDLKARMESSPPTLLSLPGEIRNLIYFYAADMSDISSQLTRTMKAWVAEDPEQNKTHPRYPLRTTPTILLLNKQIHSEAKSIIYAKALVLNMPEDRKLGKATETLNALRLISPHTLAKVQHLQVYVESWEWVYSLDKFLPHLAKVHALKTFKFTFRDALKNTFLKQDKAYPDHTLHVTMSGLAKLRGIGLVEFEGELPAVYTAPLKTIMESPKMPGEVLPDLRGVKAVWDVENKDIMELQIVDLEE